VRNRNLQTIYSSHDTATWDEVGTCPEKSWDITFGEGVYAICPKSGTFCTSPDLQNWTQINSGSYLSSILYKSGGEDTTLAYYGGCFYVGSPNGKIVRSCDGGVNWRLCSSISIGGGEYLRCIRWCEKWKKWIATTVAKCYLSKQGSIQFSNITPAIGETTSAIIEKRREFSIEPSQISDDNTVAFKMKNLRLNSVEIISCYDLLTVTSGSVYQYYFVNDEIKGFIGRTEDVETLKENQGVSLLHLDNPLNDNVAAGNWICFQGDGKLDVTVTNESYITYKNADEESTTERVDDSTVLQISTDKFYYGDRYSDGYYHIKLLLSGVRVSNPTLRISR
jgi:hypothetical protein